MIRTAILGAGIGAKHLAGMLALPERYAPRVVCDLDPAKAAALAALTPDCAVKTEADAVFADAEIDLIAVCLPPHLHEWAASAALKAGKHVVCEKPLVESLAAADRLISLAESCGRHLFPVFQYRYGPGLSKLRALIEAGLAGEPFAATLETHWDRDAEYYAIPWRGTWAGERGGAILGHAIHAHDLLTHLLGPAAEVAAFTATRVNPIEVEDCAALAIRLENGALATSSVTLGAAENMSRLRFCFRGLTAESGLEPYAPAESPWRFTARAPVIQAEVDAVLTKTAPGLSSYAGLYAEVADALADRPNAAPTPEDGRRSLAFVSAVYASARAGGAPVALGEASELYEGWVPEPLPQGD